MLLVSVSDPSFNCMGKFFFFFFLLAGEGGKREKNVLAKMVGTTIFSMVWWIRLEVTIRGRRVTAGERSSPETIL